MSRMSLISVGVKTTPSETKTKTTLSETKTDAKTTLSETKTTTESIQNQPMIWKLNLVRLYVLYKDENTKQSYVK